MTEGIGRISSMAINQTLQRDVGGLQSRLYQYQDQLSSGFKSRTFSGISGSVELFVDMQTKVRKADMYSDNIEVATTRMATANTSLDQIIQNAQSIKGLMTEWRSSSSKSLSFSQQMVQMRDGVSSALNASMEGRYLFSGTRTDMPPIKQPMPEPTEVGVPDASYYQGSQANATFRAQDNYEASYAVRADDPAFQKIYSAMRLSMQADAEKSDSKMAQALDMLQDGIDGVIAVQTQANVTSIGLKDIQDRHKSTKSYFQGLVDSVVKTDIVDVSTKLAFDQSTLQAAYQAFSKINSLHLSDYLK